MKFDIIKSIYDKFFLNTNNSKVYLLPYKAIQQLALPIQFNIENKDRQPVVTLNAQLYTVPIETDSIFKRKVMLLGNTFRYVNITKIKGEIIMTGILIIHGFAGNRDDVKPLYNFLSQKGYTVSMPCLSGHELGHKELALSTRHEWVKSAEEAYLELSEKYDNIIVIGFSMGGLVAAQLYQKHKFNKLITVNTPIYYWDIKRIVKNIISDFKKYSTKYFTESTNKPLRSLLQFQSLLSETKPLFKNIDCNCLIIQAQDDDTVHAKSAEYIYKHISGNKNIFKPSLGGHFIFISDNKTEVIDNIDLFIKNEPCR